MINYVLKKKMNTKHIDREYDINSSKAPIVLVLDNIRSASNVGSIFRTADSLNVEKIYLCGITAIPPNKQLLKTALGSTDSVNWEFVNDICFLINKLKSEPNTRIVSAEQTNYSVSLFDFQPVINCKIVFIFGNEVEGVSKNLLDLSDECVEIPQFGIKKSLNVSVCAGIMLWDTMTKLNSYNSNK